MLPDLHTGIPGPQQPDLPILQDQPFCLSAKSLPKDNRQPLRHWPHQTPLPRADTFLHAPPAPINLLDHGKLAVPNICPRPPAYIPRPHPSTMAHSGLTSLCCLLPALTP